jgi:hypothetical protein
VAGVRLQGDVDGLRFTRLIHAPAVLVERQRADFGEGTSGEE